jgi:hypothetical protein
MPFDATNPATFDAIQSGGKLDDTQSRQPIGTGSQSQSPATATASDSARQGMSTAHSMPSGTQRNLFLHGEADGVGGHPTHPKLARLQNPDTPLYLHKPLKYPVNTGM